ncbi:MAG: hypothetical protein KGZ68_17075 [Dechloromonas sp.]|nr:hypothetical protein [Dechloromonas sp.]
MPEPIVIHRHVFSGDALIEALLPGASARYDRAALTIEDDAVTIDLIGPKVAEPKGDAPPTAMNEKAKSNVAEEPELKGGDRARRAAMRCGEQLFQRFVGAECKDTAKAIILHRCGVTSRKLFDHDLKAAAAWRTIEDRYQLWRQGHDIEF